MKKIFLSFALLLFASMFMLLQAQDEKKVIIIKKTINENGVETVEETILEGEDANDFNMEDIDINEDGENINIEVDVRKILGEGEEGSDMMKKKIRILRKGDSAKDAEVEIDMGEGEMKIIKIDEDGQGLIEGDHKMMIFINDGDGKELPEDIEKILEREGIQWNEEGGNRRIVIHDRDNSEPRAFLGVWPGEEVEQGISLGGVVKESAAEKAGLKEGDIVVSIAGEKTKTFSDLSKIIKNQEPGDVVKIEFIREGKTQSVDVTLGKGESRVESFMHLNKNHSCSDNSDKVIRYFEKCDTKKKCCSKMVEKAYIGIMIEDHEDGVKIVEVNREDDVLGDLDVITKFGKVKISDMQSLIDEVAKHEPGDRVKVQFVRNGEIQKKKVTLLGRMVKECYKDENCCDKKEQTESIIVEEKENSIIKSDTGNALLELKDLSLYPNPNAGNFSMSFSSEIIAPVSISITDATGKEILRDEISDFNGKYFGEFTLKGNTPGVYFMNISQNGRVFTEKIILNAGK